MLRKRWPLWVVWHLLYFLASQYSRLLETRMQIASPENVMGLATQASLALSFDLFWYCGFFAAVVCTVADSEHDRPQTPFFTILMRHLNPLVIENIRVLARVIAWAPALLLPAFYQYVRLFMTSFVVILNPQYEEGRLGALERSKQLTKGRFGLCVLAILLAVSFEPAVSAIIMGGEIAVWQNPMRVLLSLPVSLVLNLWTVIFLLSVYQALDQARPVVDAVNQE